MEHSVPTATAEFYGRLGGSDSHFGPGYEEASVHPRDEYEEKTRRETAKVLGGWLEDHNRERDDATLAKAALYGGADMRIMGAAMAELAKGVQWSPDERQQEEMAVGFYLLGKVARMFGAWAKGRDPSEDTPLDTEVYAQMMQKVRQTGTWTP